MKIFFSEINELNENIKHIKSYKEESERLLGILDFECATLDYYSKKGVTENKLYVGAVNEFQKDYFKMCINWADKTLKKLEENN